MPTVSRQSPRAAAEKNGQGVLSRIAPVRANVDGIKLCCYGRPKSGKTRLACSFPKPLLLVGTEDGTKSVATIKGVDFVRLSETAEVNELAAMLRGGKYKTAVLDTAGGLQDMILKEILGLEDVPVQKSWGMAQQKDWQVCGAQTKERLRCLLDLADTDEMNVVVIAHERNFNEEGNTDVMLPSIGAALTPTVAGWLNAACDYVCQTYIREEIVEQTMNIGGRETRQNKKTGKKEFCLRVGPHNVYLTGFRLPPGVELPDSIPSPSYDKIAKLIAGQ